MKPNEITKIANAVVLAISDNWQRQIGFLFSRLDKIEEALKQKIVTPAPEAVKLCRDCRHCVPRRDFFVKSYEFSRCGHPSQVSPVDGAAREYCSTRRVTYGDGTYIKTCGPAGKWFESKHPKGSDKEKA